MQCWLSVHIASCACSLTSGIRMYLCLIWYSLPIYALDHLPDRRLHFAFRGYVTDIWWLWDTADFGGSYFVTELLGTDLQRLLATRRLDTPYTQYFTYQIVKALKVPELYRWRMNNDDGSIYIPLVWFIATWNRATFWSTRTAIWSYATLA